MEIPNGGPYWLTVVLFVLFGTPAVFSKAAARLPGAFGWAARKVQNRVGQSASERVANREIARLERRYDELAQDCAEDARKADARAEALERRLDALELEVTQTKTKFFALLGYTRRIIATLPPDHPLPAVPSELSEWLGHG